LNHFKYILATLLVAVSTNCMSGAWGVGSFENDSAMDWVYELEQSKSSSLLNVTFGLVQGDGYLEVDSCSAVMAAAEIVAAMKSKSYIKLPKNVKTWAKLNATALNAELVSKAKASIAYCTNQSNSELAQLWQESSEKEWFNNISELNSKLK
jgi:hypothetical protein